MLSPESREQNNLSAKTIGNTPATLYILVDDVDGVREWIRRPAHHARQMISGLSVTDDLSLHVRVERHAAPLPVGSGGRTGAIGVSLLL